MGKTRALLSGFCLFVAALAFGQGSSLPVTNLTTEQLSFPIYTLNPTPISQVNVTTVGLRGITTYYYWVVAHYLVGTLSPSGPFPITTAPDTLSSGNYDQISFTYPLGMTSVDVLRTNSLAPPVGACACAVATGITSGNINDQSNSLSAYSVPAAVVPNNFILNVQNEVQSAGVTHLILRQGPANTFVADLSNASSGNLPGGCSAGQTATWNGSTWVCTSLGVGTITGVNTNAGSGLTGGGVTGTLTLSLLTSCSPNQILAWSGSAWACTTPASSSPAGTLAYSLTGTGASSTFTPQWLDASQESGADFCAKSKAATETTINGVTSQMVSDLAFVNSSIPCANPPFTTTDSGVIQLPGGLIAAQNTWNFGSSTWLHGTSKINIEGTSGTTIQAQNAAAGFTPTPILNAGSAGTGNIFGAGADWITLDAQNLDGVSGLESDYDEEESGWDRMEVRNALVGYSFGFPGDNHVQNGGNLTNSNYSARSADGNCEALGSNLAISGVTSTGGVATFTVSSTVGLYTGYQANIVSVPTGGSGTNYNGSYYITVTSSTQFTTTILPTGADSAGSGGTVNAYPIGLRILAHSAGDMRDFRNITIGATHCTNALPVTTAGFDISGFLAVTLAAIHVEEFPIGGSIGANAPTSNVTIQGAAMDSNNATNALVTAINLSGNFCPLRDIGVHNINMRGSAFGPTNVLVDQCNANTLTQAHTGQSVFQYDLDGSGFPHALLGSCQDMTNGRCDDGTADVLMVAGAKLFSLSDVTGQINIDPNNTGVIALTVNNPAGSSVDIADFKVGGIAQARIDQTGNLTIAGLLTMKGSSLGSATLGASATGGILQLNGANATVTAAGAAMFSGSLSAAGITSAPSLTGTIGLLVDNPLSTSANLADFQVNGANLLIIDNLGDINLLQGYIELATGAAPSGIAGHILSYGVSTGERPGFNPNNTGDFRYVGVNNASLGTSGNCKEFAANGIDDVDAGAACVTGVLQVGGSSLTAGDTVNFNNTVPVAEANALNIHFQTSRASTTDSISGEIVGDGTASHFLSGAGTWLTPSGSGFANPMTTLGDLIYENATPTAARLAGPTSPNGVPQFLIDVPSGGAAAAQAWALAGIPIDATNPATLLVTDRANYLNWTSGASLALPAVATTFASNFPFVLKNTSGGTLTVTPNAAASDLINGAATAAILNNYASLVYQDSTTAPGHWFTVQFPTEVIAVTSAAALTNTALMTGAGLLAAQTPSTTSTLDSSGNLAVAAGGSLGSADTGTPKFTFATNKATFNQPLYLGTTTNQLVAGTSTNLTTLTFPAPSGAVTLTFPLTSELIAGINSDTTTSHIAHSTAVAGVQNMTALVTADFTTAVNSRSLTVTDLAPVTGDDNLITVIDPVTAVHLTRLSCGVTGTTSVVVNLVDASGSLVADTTCTAGTINQVVVTTWANGSSQCGGTSNCAVGAHVPVTLHIGTISGTPTGLQVGIDYTVD